MPEGTNAAPQSRDGADRAAQAIHPVILSGGSGTRLWPQSRSAYPKQFLALTGGTTTLLQATAQRVADTARFAPLLVVANDDHRFIIAEQLRQAGIKPDAILLEPVARNTAPAIAAAALWLSARDPDALMLCLPADHVIADAAAFRAAIDRGSLAAARGHLVTFGINAETPETGYGYIKGGAPLDAAADSGVFAIDRFVEKPDLEHAAAYVAAGDYTWNSGIFLFSAAAYLAEYRRLQPESLAHVEASVTDAVSDLDFVRLDKAGFSAAKSDSIDYAVLEHTARAAVVPVKMGWSDLGAWDAIWDIAAKDASGNATSGDVIAVDCKNSYLHSDETLLAAIGLDGLLVVTTADAVMVAPKGRAQDVKKLVDRLRADGRIEAVHHATVHRPWGTYRSIHQGERVQVKHIMVKPGAALSLQKHHHRAEHWVVVSGTATVVRDDEVLTLTENQSTYIPLGAKHRLENPGRLPLHIIEVQSGAYLGEDDIVRYEDVYGRA